MEALLYTSLFCFMLLASHGFPNPDETNEDSDTEYDDYDSKETTEPLPTTTTKVPCLSFLHLKSDTDMKPIGCMKHCPNNYAKMPEGIPCYALTLEYARSMDKKQDYDCPLGNCKHGSCVKNGTTEKCRRVGTLRPE
uniref:Evasin n=1 Tax=Amblyomma cajennense TaxID=34607 RepID=A0A023FG08_AMBCJ